MAHNVPKGDKRTELKRKLAEFARDIGHTPTSTELDEKGPHSARHYQNHFGSWNDALRAAGLDVRREMDVSEEDLIEDLRRLQEEFGRAPRYNEVEPESRFSTGTYEDRFGSWNESLKAAGIGVTKRNDITDEELLDELKSLYQRFGRTPMIEEMDEYGEFAGCTYSERFGSWANAVREIGCSPNWGRPLEDQIKWYGPNWDTARDRARKRDDYQCVLCGTPEEEYKKRTGRALDVHHIVPFVNYRQPDGTIEYSKANDLSNLATLCRKCHSKWEGIPLLPETPD